MELYELRQFTAFADAGTLSEAAEILHLSQPALSRNMKKLEEELGIPLFTRSRNKLELNENGRYVLELAKKLLNDADALPVRARDFDRKSRTISLGTCAPAPIWTLTPLIANLFPHMSLRTEFHTEPGLLSGLDNDIYQLVILPEKPVGEAYFCKKCGTESLMFALPKGHRYARRKSLTFEEMNGENMLLMPDIGFWSFVMELMPDSRFLTQNDRFSFEELVQASSLPSFVTDLSQTYLHSSQGRIFVPISDPEATATYYLICKAEQKKVFHPLFQAL